jgi:hypothetical protein
MLEQEMYGQLWLNRSEPIRIDGDGDDDSKKDDGKNGDDREGNRAKGGDNSDDTLVQQGDEGASVPP